MRENIQELRELLKLMVMSRLEAYGALHRSDICETDPCYETYNCGSTDTNAILLGLAKDGLAERRSLFRGRVFAVGSTPQDYMLVITDAGRQYLQEHQTDLERLRAKFGDLIEMNPPVWLEWVMQGSAVQQQAPGSKDASPDLDTVTALVTDKIRHERK